MDQPKQEKNYGYSKDFYSLPNNHAKTLLIAYDPIELHKAASGPQQNPFKALTAARNSTA
jgi:hypothetical protein